MHDLAMKSYTSLLLVHGTAHPASHAICLYILIPEAVTSEAFWVLNTQTKCLNHLEFNAQRSYSRLHSETTTLASIFRFRLTEIGWYLCSHQKLWLQTHFWCIYRPTARGTCLVTANFVLCTAKGANSAIINPLARFNDPASRRGKGKGKGKNVGKRQGSKGMEGTEGTG